MTKRQYKNRIKKIRVRAKSKFYLHWRPMAQKLFFPIMALIILIGILNYERNERGTIEFTNAAVVTDSEKGQESFKDSAEAPINTPTLVSKVSAPATPGVVETKIREVFHMAPEKAVKVFTCESHLNPARHSEVDIMADGRAFSVGVAQINLTVTNVGGLNCPDAFKGRNKYADVIDEKLYASCVHAAEDLDTNLAAAIPKYERRGDFSAWQWCDNKTNEVATL